MGKESGYKAGDTGDMSLILGSRRSPGISALQPTPLFLPGESHGWKSLVGYSPWDHKELDMTEATEHTRVLFMLHFFSFVDL